MANTNYSSYTHKFASTNPDGTNSPSVNVCSGPYNSLTEATTDAKYVFDSLSLIPDGLHTSIWVNGKLEEYVWYNQLWNLKALGNSSDVDFTKFNLKFIYRTTSTSTIPSFNVSSITTPINWSETLSSTETGYLWMSCQKIYNGNAVPWHDDVYWKTPTFIGKTSTPGGTSNLEDIKFIYKVVSSGVTPELDVTKQTSLPTGWKVTAATNESGCVWMSCARVKEDGSIYAWPNGNFWKAPMYLGYASAISQEDLDENPGSYTPISAFKKTANKTIVTNVASFLNRNDYNYPPTGWVLSLVSFDDLAGYIWLTTARKDSNGNLCTWADGNIWSEPILINTVGDPEKEYIPTNLLTFSKLFGLVEAEPDGTPKSGLTFDTSITIMSDGNPISGDYQIEVNGVVITGSTPVSVYKTPGRTTGVTCYRIGNTLYFQPLTTWTNTNTVALQVTATSGEISVLGNFLLAKVNAGESIQGIEGSVIRYRGLLKNLKANDVLCYKLSENGDTEGITYIDYVKASPSEFGDGGSVLTENYYLFTGEHSGKLCMKVSLAKAYIDNFEKTESFQFIATDVLLAEDALIKNLQSNVLFFYDDSNGTTTDHITGGITGSPSHLGGNYLIFGGSLDNDGSTWINPNFRVDLNGLLHLNYTTYAATSEEADSINYKAYTWQQNIDSLLSQFSSLSRTTDDLVTKYSTFELTIDSTTAKVEKEEKTVKGYSEKYAEWELTVDGFTTKVRDYVEEYGKIKDQYSQFQVTASKIEAMVKEEVDGLDTKMSKITQTASSIQALITSNNSILTSLGLDESGIHMVGKVLEYKTASNEDPILQVNTKGLTIKGNIIAESFSCDSTTINNLKTNLGISELSDTIKSIQTYSSLDDFFSKVGDLLTYITKNGIYTKTVVSNEVISKTLYSSSIYLGSTAELSSWALISNGSGWVANKSISWDTLGNVTLDEKVKILYKNNGTTTSKDLASYLSAEISKLGDAGSSVLLWLENSDNVTLMSTELGNNYLQSSWIDTGLISAVNGHINELDVKKLKVTHINGHDVSTMFTGKDTIGGGTISGGTIAGWKISTDAIKSNKEFTSGSTTIPSCQLNADGTGWFANGNLNWDNDGNLRIGGTNKWLALSKDSFSIISKSYTALKPGLSEGLVNSSSVDFLFETDGYFTHPKIKLNALSSMPGGSGSYSSYLSDVALYFDETAGGAISNAHLYNCEVSNLKICNESITDYPTYITLESNDLNYHYVKSGADTYSIKSISWKNLIDILTILYERQLNGTL